ncbi:unnamed protein product [Peronospora belbahrii]|uniref:Uncharacterized protein n=1 Tax=Peronospora belbahrii TaxID=622444 RepID=A0AAU9LAZ2_9STRA|nr:unnamed protein product [Peronospora belbahrii]CAH0518067.1 unnamed protein product [Peronospora belbahrii]
MEVVALNARLRSDFSVLLKQLPRLGNIPILSTMSVSVCDTRSPSPAVSNDLYTQHCRFMLRRLNSYQYDSTSAFLRDLEQLERMAESPIMKQQVKNIVDRLSVSEGGKRDEKSLVKAANLCGTTVSLGSSSDVLGLQEVTSIGSSEEETEANTMWLCNLTLNHQILTIGTFKTKEEAFHGYEEQRKLMAKSAAGFNNMKLLIANLEEEQRKEDTRVLKEAVAQCHPRLTTMKVTALTLAPPANNMASIARGIPRFVARSVAAVTASSSPEASHVPSETEASPRRIVKASKRHGAENSISAAVSTKRVISVGNSAASSSSAGDRSYLKLRRRIQKRLCRHLKGKEVCVLSSSDKFEGRLRASGRLEAGKVFSFRRKKQISFADYVCDELGRAESACAHMFLIRSRESIDDHLKVCDAFVDNEHEPARSHLTPRKKRRSITPDTLTR